MTGHRMGTHPDPRAGKDCTVLLHTDTGPVAMSVRCEPGEFSSPGAQVIHQHRGYLRRTSSAIDSHIRGLLPAE